MPSGVALKAVARGSLGTCRAISSALPRPTTPAKLDTSQNSASVITPIDLFASVEPAGDVVRVAAWFRYDWTLNDGRTVDFTCVDVFGFRPGSALIQSMHIVYDTHPLREQVGDKYAPDPRG